MARVDFGANPSLKMLQVNNFGARQRVGQRLPNFDEFVRLQVDFVCSWTVSLDVIQITENTRAVARIEYGGGSAVSTLLVDAADHIDVPVVGSMIRVGAAIEPILPIEGGPPPLTAESAVLISVGLSSEIPAATSILPGYQVPYFGTPIQSGIFGRFNPSGLGSIDLAPVRVAGFHALGVTGNVFFMLFNQTAEPVAGDVPVWVEPLAAGAVIDREFLRPKAFAAGCWWKLSATGDRYTAPAPGAATAEVFGELTQRPFGVLVDKIASTS